jgi:hypothetical protein
MQDRQRAAALETQVCHGICDFFENFLALSNLVARAVGAKIAMQLSMEAFHLVKRQANRTCDVPGALPG